MYKPSDYPRDIANRQTAPPRKRPYAPGAIAAARLTERINSIRPTKEGMRATTSRTDNQIRTLHRP
jgi:hypothetical protein